jgi:hypothetical protein
MNRRQEAVVYVVGVLLAGISAYNGHENEEWLFGAFVPVLILGILVVYALRTRGEAAEAPAEVLKKGLGVTIAVVVAAQLLTQIERVQAQVSSVETDVRQAVWDSEGARREIVDAKYKAIEAGIEASEAKREVADLRGDVDHLGSQVRNFELGQLMRR